jgi:hypothetical protein
VIESAGGGRARAITTAQDRARGADAGVQPGAGEEALVQHSPFAFSPRSWLRRLDGWLVGWRRVGLLLVLMGAAGLLAVLLGWYPAP